MQREGTRKGENMHGSRKAKVSEKRFLTFSKNKNITPVLCQCCDIYASFGLCCQRPATSMHHEKRIVNSRGSQHRATELENSSTNYNPRSPLFAEFRKIMILFFPSKLYSYIWSREIFRTIPEKFRHSQHISRFRMDSTWLRLMTTKSGATG